jgi:hypothetical protein
MGSYRLSKRLSSTLLTDAWAGTTVTGKPVVAHTRRLPWSTAGSFASKVAPFGRGWQGLRQAGIVPLVEIGLSSATPWVVEEFIEGETARTLMNVALTQKAPVSLRESLPIVAQAAHGMLTLSKQLPPLRHGDICGSNIIVSNDGDVRLSLIGVAAAQEADTGFGPARAELFSIAPEEIAGPSTSATDVFRLGLVFLELITGRTLFSGTTHAEVKARVEKYPGLTGQHFPSLPPPLASLLAAMLAKSPSDRPTAGDVEAALVRAFEPGGEGPQRTVTAAFARLMKGRSLVLNELEGGESLVLTALTSTSSTAPAPVTIGATTSDGAVTLAKVNTKRMTGEEMAAVRAAEVAEASRVAGEEWHARHAGDDGNPKDFALGQVLLEQQLVTLEQADAGLVHAQSFGSTLFAALVFLGHLDEDVGLPLAAQLLRYRWLTGPQLLELNLSPANAPLLPRDTAEQWQVLPLRLEAGGLLVAIADPGRLDVLDEIKRRAKTRSVTAMCATERTLIEGLQRVYDGKTGLPDWARPKTKPVASSLQALDDFELAPLDDLGLPPPPSSAPAMSPLPPMPSAPSPARAPMSSPPMARPMPSAQVAPSATLPTGLPTLNIATRLFDAVLSLVPERGAEGARLLGLVRAVAKQSGASGAPFEQTSLYATAVVIAALLDGKRAFDRPSLPAVSAVLGTHWNDAKDLVSPLLDADDSPPTDPRSVVLSLCFSVAARGGAVPATLAEATSALQHLRSSYPPQALAALEVVLSR